MILPWHTDLFQLGRTVCVVFRASPLIWPTSSGAHQAPRPLCFLRRQQGAPPVVFRAGLWVLGGSACSITVPALRYRFGGDCLFVMCKYGWAG